MQEKEKIIKEDTTKEIQSVQEMDNMEQQEKAERVSIRKRKKGWRNHIGNLLLVAGIVVICIPFIGRYLADREQEKMLKEFYDQINSEAIVQETEKLNQELGYTDDETLQRDLDEAAKAIEEISLNEGLNTENVTKLKTGPTAVGIIDIPKISLKYPIAEGVDNVTLRFCIGHMPGTATLGKNGNSVLAGHRSHSFGSFFNRLDELIVNDIINIQTKESTTSYVVYEKKRVHKTDLSVLASNPKSREITLITCELGINPEERIIVKAKAEAIAEGETSK